MKFTTISKTTIAVFLCLILLVCNQRVCRAEAADEKGMFNDYYNHYYYQLDEHEKLLYDQLSFEVYEDDPENAYCIINIDLDDFTADSISNAIQAYHDDGYLPLVYQLDAIEIYVEKEGNEEYLIITIPLFTECVEAYSILLSAYLDCACELASYYHDNMDAAVSLLIQATVELVNKGIVDAMDAVRLLELGLESMAVPTVTTSYGESTKLYTCYCISGDEEWMVVDLESLVGDDTIEVVEYSFEKRELLPGETEEVVKLYHMYYYNSGSVYPTTHYNILDAEGKLVAADSWVELYVPLDEAQFDVCYFTSYGEPITAIQNYSGEALVRNKDHWYEQEQVNNLQAYFHKDAAIVYAYKYTRRVSVE